MTSSWLFGAIVIASLAIIAFVVVVGGIVCVREDSYTFAAYLSDLSGCWKLFASALIGTFGRAVLPLIAHRAET